MATQETTKLGDAHEPRGESLKAFNEFAHELKKELVHLRHDHDKHAPESFAVARNVSDHELAHFSADDFVLVRVAPTAYGFILFGKLRIPALVAQGEELAYIHFRAFSDGPDQEARIHSFHSKETIIPDDADGRHEYCSLFTKDEPLEWFDS